MSLADLEADRATWRRIAEFALPGAAIGVAFLTPVAYWSRLPEPLASHWGVSGAPDASAPRLVDLLVIGFVTVTIALGPILAARAPMPRSMARLLVGTAWAGSATFATLRVLTVRANLDVPSWQQASEVTGLTMLAVLGIATVAAVFGVLLAGDRPDHQRSTYSVDAATVKPGEAVVWVSGTSSRLGALVASVLVLVAGLGAWLLPGQGRIIFVAAILMAALAMTVMGQCRVTVGPRGMTVRLGWLGWPRLSVPIAQVTDVRVEDIDPMSYGGWGVRSVPGATGVIIRAGEGIRVERTTGRALVVAVDDAAVGAGVLLAHVAVARKEA
ncbi:MAG: hypothetical protein CVT64_09095 [Actinobacteria bacterium HGW-Actinobacteria-4]|nr:MAG: hypothetical protein CVT64_09095 [Actinobacteria bacterium HGW-Actinobacteria-4]